MVAADAATPDERMTVALTAIAHPVRLALLRELRAPKVLREIEVRPSGPAPRAAGLPDRNLARQSVKEHLDRLVASGIVIARDAERTRGPTTEYVLNNQELFALSEQIRLLARLKPAAEPAKDTIAETPALPSSPVTGPRLILVKGVDEGRVFSLASAGAARWTIGRRRSAEVPLDFDPFASSDNAVVVREESRFVIADVAGSRNGTTLNLVPLPSGDRSPLRHGDLVGVGRSYLLFRTD